MSTQRDCQYCATRFTVKKSQRLFCSNRCRTRYHRENRLKCFYCGELADCRDHIHPHSAQLEHGKRGRKYRGQDTVSACNECNGMMSDRHPNSLLNRIEYLIKKIDKKYQLDKRIPEWSEDEIDDLGRDLRRMVLAKIKERQRALERRSHAKIVYDRILRMTYEEPEEPEVDQETVG